MAIRRTIELKGIQRNLQLFDGRANDAIAKVFNFQQGRSEAYMKSNAPWRDDTGNARNGLFAVVTREASQHWLILSHSVNYGIYLETMQAGRFGIIVPAWRQGSDELWRTLSKLFSMMEGG